ncbi:MAG: carboxypeptidase regulatory-like domain-containing protein [Acidimicrobiales bacterium]|nr:carboxypeptidase regulatory-like domain-containing protein [Acidimicrobiales bacterium]
MQRRPISNVRLLGAVAVAALLATLVVGLSPTSPVGADANESPVSSFPARSVSAGRDHTCAIVTDAAVRCWGRNDAGQLGLGDTASRGDAPGEMGSNLPTVDLGPGRHATALAAGASHTCALLDNATVKCWGANNLGQLGLGNTANRGDQAGEMGNSLLAVSLGTGRTATAITAGDAHTCALLDNATVKCWGGNTFGQLGLGDIDHRGDAAVEMGDNLLAVSLGGGFTATAIAAGGEFTCAISASQTKCWGRNDRGQLGQGDNVNRGDDLGEMGLNLPAISLGTSRSATAISAGNKHVCARLDNASVKCWGSNSFGHLGLGDAFDRGDGAGEMGDTLPAVALGTGRTANAITTGAFHTCALLDNATVRCWGSNDFGEAGTGDTTIRGDDSGEMGDNLPEVTLGAGRTATAVTAGSTHSCARLDDRSLKCWGLNDHGRLGLGDVVNRGGGPSQMGDNLPRVALDDRARTLITVDAGNDHTCAVVDNATLRCWGEGNAGRLGRGDTVDRGDQPDELGNVSPPIDLGTQRTVRAVSAGGQHTCALLDNGTVKCFGANNFGQLGLGDTFPRGDEPGEMGDNLPAVNLGTGRTAVAIDTGALHSCALLDDGTVKCWGLNSSGELGLGDTTARGDGPGEMGDNLPTANLGTGRTATALGIGPDGRFACVRLDNGAVRCWGLNSSGQLGIGETANRGDGPGEMGDNLPMANLGTARTATALAVGNRHVCATLDSRATKCWGENSNGQLGLGATDDRGDAPGEMGNALPAVSLGTGRTSVAITAGGDFSCAVLDNAALKCWGRNADGQLGLGDTDDRGEASGDMGNPLPPLSLGAGRTATAVTAGRAHTCARLNTGAVKCWGLNTAGRLGVGDSNTRGDAGGEMGDNLALVDLGSAPGSAVWGRVTSATTGAPLSGVFVVVMRSDDFSIERGAVSANDGTFSAAVEPGSYFAYLIDGTGSHTSGFAGAPTLLNVAAGSVADLAAPMAPTRGSITGTITESGPATPIPGGIAISLTGGGVPEVAPVGDPNGAYALPALTAGPHYIGFVDPSGAHPSRFHPNSPNVPDATPLAVTAGGSVSASGSLPTQSATATGAALTGTVENDAGQPLRGVMVVAMHAADFRMARAVLTGTAGQYSIDVTPGSYKLVFLDVTGRHDMEWYDDEAYFGIANAENATAPGTADAQLDRRTGTLSGTVTRQENGNPLGGAWVVAIGPTGPIGSTITAPNGTYAIAGLPQDNYRIAFVDPTASRGTEYFDDAADYFTATPVAVTAGDTTTANTALALL